MPNIITVIICEDHIYQTALQKCIASIKYFHPEFEIIVYNTEKINEVKKELNCQDIRYVAPKICQKIWEEKKPDILLKIGADCMFLGRIDDALSWEYDLAAPMNDSWFIGERDERRNRPDIIRDIHNKYWVNCDTVIIKNKKFIDKWVELTNDYATGKQLACKDYEQVYAGDDQAALNVCAYTNNFKVCVLDLVDLKVTYGASNNWSGEKDFANNLTPSLQKSNQKNCWPAWKYFYLDDQGNTIVPDNGIGLGPRIVKIIHSSGGTYEPKMSFDLFNIEYKKHLKKITGFEE